MKTPNYGYVAFVSSIRLQFLLETLRLLIISIVYITYFVLWIAKTVDMNSTYAKITASSSSTDINNYYATLYSQGQDWFTYFRA